MLPIVLAVLAVSCLVSEAFISTHSRVFGISSSRVFLADEPVSKGFGKKIEVIKEEVEKDAGTKTYESMAKRGVPEYNIFIRQIKGSDQDWVPVGSMAIPRDTKVGSAIFEVEDELLKGTFKLYPKLKAFYDVRADKTDVFEYGHCLKAFPDEPIVPVVRDGAGGTGERNFFSNWLDKITNPIDTTKLNSNDKTLKQ